MLLLSSRITKCVCEACMSDCTIFAVDVEQNCYIIFDSKAILLPICDNAYVCIKACLQSYKLHTSEECDEAAEICLT